MKNKTAGFIVVFLIFTSCSLEKEAKKELKISERPDYLATIFVEINGKPVGVGGGFLVNHQRKLVATAAHVILFKRKESKERIFRVFIKNKSYEANFISRFMDASKDIAFLELQLTDEELKTLPGPIELANEIWLENSHFYILGGTVQETDKTGILQTFYNYSPGQDFVYEKREVELIGINIPHNSLSSEDETRDRETKLEISLGKRKLEPEDEIIFYENFLVFTNPDWNLKSPVKHSGYSGGPIVNSGGKVVAILQGSNGIRISAIPVKDINDFLERLE